MNVLFPAFLVGALAVAIPLALHFMRRDVAPEVPFSAVRLLRRSPLERSRRRRLRDLLLLAARVAALLLLAAAFARPYFAGASASAGTVVIVAIDRSASMGAPGRFAQAAAIASQAIDEAAGGHVALVAFDDRAEVVAAPGAAAEARIALASLEATGGGTRYDALFSRVAEIAAARPGRVVVVTDLQRAGWEEARRGVLPADLQLELRNVGAPPPNVAVQGARVEADRLVALLRNTGEAAREGRLTAVRDGVDVASVRYTLGAAASLEVPVPYRAPARGALSVSVEDATGAVADNSYHVLLAAPARPRILIVTASTSPRSGFYFSRALAAAADGESSGGSFDVRAVANRDISAFAPQDYEPFAAVALLSTRGLDRRAREGLNGIVRRGGGALVVAGPDLEPDVLATIFGWPTPLADTDHESGPLALAAMDERHPIFSPFEGLAANLGQARFDRTWKVNAEGWSVLARFSDGSPALLERREGPGRVVLFGSDVDRRWNDLPLQSAFVPFAIETIRHAAGHRPATGAYTVSAVPEGVPARPGIHAVPAAAAGAPGTVVVNVDPRESVSAVMTAAEFEQMLDRPAPTMARAVTVEARLTEARQSYWQYGLLLMLGALVVESFVGRA